MARFELATSWSQTRRDNRATLHPERKKYLLGFIGNTLTMKNFYKNFFAERVGFEPTVQFNPYDDLANRSFRPLRHLSEIPILNLTLPFVRQMAEPLLTCPIIKGWQKYNCMCYHPKLNGKYV